MRILFLGDVVGRTARNTVMQSLPALREELAADFIIVNVENSAGGFGITPGIADAFLAAGVDAMTTGNHVWDRREIFAYIADQPRLLRPHNMPEGTPGAGTVIVENKNGARLGVANIMCNLFMHETGPVFGGLNEVLDEVRMGDNADALVVDIHGEATSEKMALGIIADGRASLVVGTHTHVPTADHRILPKGTAFQSDTGMCGCYDSVIGMDAETAIGRFFHGRDVRLEVAKGEITICGVLVETDDATGLARSITPIRRGGLLESV